MADITLIDKPISQQELQEIAERGFGDMVKAVVDISQGIMAAGGELHADVEAFLLDRGSDQKNLWGINLYPELDMPAMLEFDSMINIRPAQQNKSRSVEDEGIRNMIKEVVNKLIAS